MYIYPLDMYWKEDISVAGAKFNIILWHEQQGSRRPIDTYLFRELREFPRCRKADYLPHP